jgi:hypothetical protein
MVSIGIYLINTSINFICDKSEKWPKPMFITPSQCLIISVNFNCMMCVQLNYITWSREKNIILWQKCCHVIHFSQPHLGCWIIKARVANFQQSHLASTTLGIVPIRLQLSRQSRTHICSGSYNWAAGATWRERERERERCTPQSAESFIKFLFVPSTKATCARGEILSRSIKKMSRRWN